MLAGTMDRRLTLQQPTHARGAAGEDVRGWADVATVWAQRIDARGREVFQAGAVAGVAETVWRIRWRQDLVDAGPAWRAIIGTQAFDIQSVAEIGRHDMLELRCIRAADGVTP
jgi:SPP1 family predicted phage head-tail adaptor